MIPFPYQSGQLGRRVVPVAGGGSDPDFSSVALLLHMNGTNGSTSFPDSSPNTKTLTRFGNAQISTAQSKFGGSSGLFDGTGDYLSSSVSSEYAFGTGNFTLEAFIRLNANSTGGFGNQAQSADVSTLRGVSFWIVGGSGAFRVRIGRSVTGQFDDILGSGSLATNQWYHIAVTRESTGANGVKLWVDGALNAQGTSAISINNTNFAVGRAFPTVDGEYLNGYIDELRVTSGVARYTSAFTPPTAPFPDS